MVVAPGVEHVPAPLITRLIPPRRVCFEMGRQRPEPTLMSSGPPLSGDPPRPPPPPRLLGRNPLGGISGIGGNGGGGSQHIFKRRHIGRKARLVRTRFRFGVARGLRGRRRAGSFPLPILGLSRALPGTERRSRMRPARLPQGGRQMSGTASRPAASVRRADRPNTLPSSTVCTTPMCSIQKGRLQGSKASSFGRYPFQQEVFVPLR